MDRPRFAYFGNILHTVCTHILSIALSVLVSAVATGAVCATLHLAKKQQNSQGQLTDL